MKRLIAEHFRHDGKAKTAYPDERSAALAAHVYGKDYYQCTFCGQFHLATIYHKEDEC